MEICQAAVGRDTGPATGAPPGWPTARWCGGPHPGVRLLYRHGGQNDHMDVDKLARAQSVNRVLVGTGLLLAPTAFGKTWGGPLAGDDRGRVMARALGARDLALGVAGLLAERDGDRRWAARSFAAQAFADAVDFAAIVATPRLPLGSRLFGSVMASGSAAVAAAYAARLARGDAEPAG